MLAKKKRKTLRHKFNQRQGRGMWALDKDFFFHTDYFYTSTRFLYEFIELFILNKHELVTDFLDTAMNFD